MSINNNRAVIVLFLSSMLLQGCGGCSGSEIVGDAEAQGEEPGGSDVAGDYAFDNDAFADDDLPTDSRDVNDPDGDDGESEPASTWVAAYMFTNTLFADETEIVETLDGGFIAVGTTRFSDSIAEELWAMRLDGNGQPLWQNAYAAAFEDYMGSVMAAPDGGFVVAGGTVASGGDSLDMLVLKLDAGGEIEWQRAFDLIDDDLAWAIEGTADGGFIVAGDADWWDDNQTKAAFLKLDAGGGLQWQRVFGLAEMECTVHAIRQTEGGGYVVAGSMSDASTMNWDGWILMLDQEGAMVWQKVILGPERDSMQSVLELPGGGFIATGAVESSGAGGSDLLVVRLDPAGNVAWMKTYGGPGDEIGKRIRPAPGGGFIIAGRTESFASGCEDCDDIWVLKIGDDGSVVWEKTYGGEDPEIVDSMEIASDGGIVMLGSTQSYIEGRWPFALKLDGGGEIPAACPEGFIGTSTALVGDALLPVVDATFEPVTTDVTIIDGSSDPILLHVQVEAICL